MGKTYTEISDELINFINKQKIFFVATADTTGRVNLSPKGNDSLKIIDKNRVIWLNMTGSGNETAAHIQHNSRMTIMFCSFTEKPTILHLYGNAKELQTKDNNWDKLYNKFKPSCGARQIFDVNIDLVQKSCGFGVPIFNYIKDRADLEDWANKKQKEGIKKYQQENNIISIDGVKINL